MSSTGASPVPASIMYLEIPAPDIQASGAFYSGVFGWSVEPSDLTDDAYWMFTTGEGGLTGGLDSRKPGVAGGVLIYLKVDDIPSTLDAIAEAGGSVAGEKRPVGGEFGFFAEFLDPAGNRLGLWCQT